MGVHSNPKEKYTIITQKNIIHWEIVKLGFDNNKPEFGDVSDLDYRYYTPEQMLAVSRGRGYDIKHARIEDVDPRIWDAEEMLMFSQLRAIPKIIIHEFTKDFYRFKNFVIRAFKFITANITCILLSYYDTLQLMVQVVA